jgi:hypothetical protein
MNSGVRAALWSFCVVVGSCGKSPTTASAPQHGAGVGSPASDPRASPAVVAASTPHGPVIVELFTSQGCSSCPPADQLIAELAVHGAQLTADQTPVLPLSFHVDYWNQLGWRDPFSQSAWSERQRDYADVLGDRGVYTPQLVVGGVVGMVGSDRSAVKRQLKAAAAPMLLPATASWTSGELTVSVTAPPGRTVWLALFGQDKPTDVSSGENAGRSMITTHPVRSLQKIASNSSSEKRTIKVAATDGAVLFTQPAQGPGPIDFSAALPRPE